MAPASSSTAAPERVDEHGKRYKVDVEDTNYALLRMQNGAVGVITPGAEPEPTAPQGSHEPASTPGLGWLHLAVGGGLSGRSWRVPVLGEATPRAERAFHGCYNTY